MKPQCSLVVMCATMKYLGLNVTLPLNVSLDLGSECGAQHNLVMIDMDSSQSHATIGHKVGGHLDACLR